MCVRVHVRLCVCVLFIPCSPSRRVNDIIINDIMISVKLRLSNRIFTLTFSVAFGCPDVSLTLPLSLLLFIKQRRVYRVYGFLCVSQYNLSCENITKSEIISASLRFAAASGKRHITRVSKS